ncbi:MULTISPECIES: hypothetical protein [Aquimarina]|uniref:hypothetical protein n=1 Tax=Aquimarina TaxID=290174 RepID=UPI000A55CA1B|nr:MULTISPECIES: hypothetical protein [Aquimarina]
MNMHNQINLEYALIKYFSDKATPEEEIFVQQWVSESSDNTSYYHKIQRLWIQRIVL